MSEEKLVPKLRFNGFDDEWLEYQFEDIYEIKNGLNKGKEYFGQGIQILNYMDVNKFEFNTENTIKGLVELSNEEIERFSVKPNDLFFTRTSIYVTLNYVAINTHITNPKSTETKQITTIAKLSDDILGELILAL